MASSRFPAATDQWEKTRERRSVARGWSKREGKLRRDFDKRGSYLGNRIYELTSQIGSNEQHIRRIEDAMAEQDLASLLAPLPPSPIEGNAEVDARACTDGEDNQYKEEVSATQANRLWYQGHSALTVLKEERKRDLRQLQLTQQAKSLSDESYTTIPAVKAAEAKRFELLNEASRLRHESSLLRIAARVNSAGSRVYAASTILGWLRDFRGHGGFKRDSRGVHERDWIMSEEDLKDELIKIRKNRAGIRDFRGHGGFKRDSRGVHERDWIMSEEDLKDELIKIRKNRAGIRSNREIRVACSQ
ncbi:unnamed protein product [Ectocarpus sp. CCAP 1310/34]|nr:unnamed protein product [Ectocarpus sp. CCAP 1310/34]